MSVTYRCHRSSTKHNEFGGGSTTTGPSRSSRRKFVPYDVIVLAVSISCAESARGSVKPSLCEASTPRLSYPFLAANIDAPGTQSRNTSIARSRSNVSNARSTVPGNGSPSKNSKSPNGDGKLGGLLIDASSSAETPTLIASDRFTMARSSRRRVPVWSKQTPSVNEVDSSISCHYGWAGRSLVKGARA